MLTEREGWLRLAQADGVGPRTALLLARGLGGAARAALAREAEVRGCPGLGGAGAARIAAGLAAARAEPFLVEAERAGQTVLTPADADYPPLLRETPDPPAALFVHGRLPPAGRPAAAVVGTRAASPYGTRVARAMAETLARSGVVVVSGLARGVDGAAHDGALLGGGPTVAVLACGADFAYPPEHGQLLREVAAAGAAVSEHPPGERPRRERFPRRNRLIAGLASAVVVVEAPSRSGALVTARVANELGRDVLAVPGPVDRGRHAGCHRLLRQGAALCEGAGDVLVALGLRAPEGSDEPPPLAVEPPPGPGLVVWRAMDVDDALDVDALVAATGLGPDAVASALTLLELDGRARRVPGVGYLRA